MYLRHLKLAPLATHLESENVEFMQFAFRWMNCLLMREISVQNTIRMWDTYLVSVRISQQGSTFSDPLARQSEGAEAFSQFHLYVCSAFLVRWSHQLREMDFQVCKIPVYNPPTMTDFVKIFRGSLCSCSPCRRRTGETTKSNCYCRKPLSSTRYGITLKAILE